MVAAAGIDGKHDAAQGFDCVRIGHASHQVPHGELGDRIVIIFAAQYRGNQGGGLFCGFSGLGATAVIGAVRAWAFLDRGTELVQRWR